eukprot:CAMPEP_0119138748 /NCGR_PEP_ID=MMETSP1310-20130426/26234_1 /TAXON_ID=464262 /ORGANISM="Genus nov. species nov., Strain RCC2339" /LENGTH=620 /DNA_ID=CAMNT_0007129971 /DNA_START=33 /DNA_END=1896 /DNA_ORIENTATION=-
MSVISNVKKGRFPQVWDGYKEKLCIQLVSVKNLSDKSGKFYVRVGMKDSEGEMFASSVITVDRGEAFFDRSEYQFVEYTSMAKHPLSFEVREKFLLKEKFRGLALHTLSEREDHVEEHRLELGMRSDKDTKNVHAGAELCIRVIRSVHPESRSLVVDTNPEDDHLFHPISWKYPDVLREKLQTGDLIAFNSFGTIPSVLKVQSGRDISSVGLVVVLPNKYTREDEYFILECTRNHDAIIDAFSDKIRSGVTLLRLWDRVHQSMAQEVQWFPINPPLSEAEKAKVVENVWSLHSAREPLQQLALSSLPNKCIVDFSHRFQMKKVPSAVFAEFYSPQVVQAALKSVPSLQQLQEEEITWPGTLVGGRYYPEGITLKVTCKDKQPSMAELGRMYSSVKDHNSVLKAPGVSHTFESLVKMARPVVGGSEEPDTALSLGGEPSVAFSPVPEERGPGAGNKSEKTPSEKIRELEASVQRLEEENSYLRTQVKNQVTDQSEKNQLMDMRKMSEQRLDIPDSSGTEGELVRLPSAAKNASRLPGPLILPSIPPPKRQPTTVEKEPATPQPQLVVRHRSSSLPAISKNPFPKDDVLSPRLQVPRRDKGPRNRRPPTPKVHKNYLQHMIL